MDIVARKLNFVQEFLRISDEDLVDKLERFLRTERKKRMDKDIKPMTMNEFNQMIEKAEDDVKNSRVIEARELLKKVEKWK
jgi:peptide subunit release factor 1 (eRF1)